MTRLYSTWTTILPALALLLLPLAGRAEVPPTGTAHFYMLQPEKWEGKTVTLSVAFIMLPTDATLSEGFRPMQAFTFNNHLQGGYMHLLVAPAVVPRVVQLCGTSVSGYSSYTMPHMIQGTFKKMGEQYVVVIEK